MAGRTFGCYSCASRHWLCIARPPSLARSLILFPSIMVVNHSYIYEGHLACRRHSCAVCKMSSEKISSWVFLLYCVHYSLDSRVWVLRYLWQPDTRPMPGVSGLSIMKGCVSLDFMRHVSRSSSHVDNVKSLIWVSIRCSATEFVLMQESVNVPMIWAYSLLYHKTLQLYLISY